MMTTTRATSVPTELLGISNRLWCGQCKLPTAVRVFFTAGVEVGYVDYCTRCHGAP